MTRKYIEILSVRHLKGPSMWKYGPAPVLEALVDIQDLEDYPSNLLPGFYDRLVAWMPSLIEHRCSYDERGGFLRRLREGTWTPHIMEHVVLELQALAGLEGGFGRAREMSRRGVYKVVVTCWHEQVTRFALYGGRDLVMAAIEDRPFDVAGLVDELRDMAEDLCLGPSTASIVDAAEDRRIPTIRLNEKNLVQIGYGARQRRIWTAETNRTSAIAEGISRDKDLTNRLLRACGVAVPEGRVVESPQDAWAAAEDIGVPVVVKPIDANHGRGVCLDLSGRDDIESAYAVALEEGSGVMVERFIPGSEHRLLVVGGRMVAALRGDAAWIVGNGRSTVEALIDRQLNSDPMRSGDANAPLFRIWLDSTLKLQLRRQGLSADSVPAQGRRVLVQRNGNLTIDVTDRVHPSFCEAAALAARVIGLDIAGVDVVAEDISRPLSSQRAAIVEVNAGPGLEGHLHPASGRPQPVGRAIVDHLFAPDDDGRIPVVGITGSEGTTTVARLVAQLLHLDGMHVGLACADGLYLGRRRVTAGNCARFEPAQRLLVNRTLEAAVIENGARTMVTEGLAYDRCEVGVVTRLDPALTLPEEYIDDAEYMYKVLRTQVDVILPRGVAVLNADDPMVAQMAPLCDGDVIFFSTTSEASGLDAHRENGGRAVLVRNRRIMLAVGREETVLADLGRVPLARNGQALAEIESLLAAVGAAWALGITADLIRTGIESFDLAMPADVVTN